MKKMTNLEAYEALASVVKANASEEVKADLVDFLDKKVAQEVAKRGRVRVAKANPEVEARKEAVLAVLTDAQMTSKEVAALAGMTSGQASAALVSLAKAEKIQKFDNGKKVNTYSAK